jgi:Holliday junction DNA helicase RuvA
LIVSLRGILREKKPPTAWIDVNGVGYGVQVSLSTYEALPETGKETELFTTLVVREDSQQLYGFSTREEQRLFNLLLTVSGVGPRGALGILSGLRPEAFVRSVRDGDVAALTAVSGVGKKTAERILVELRDKVSEDRAVSAGPVLSALHQDALTALVALGFTPQKAQKSVRTAAAALPADAELEEIVRRALAESPRG